MIISVYGEKKTGKWQSLDLNLGLVDSKAQWLSTLAEHLIHWGTL